MAKTNLSSIGKVPQSWILLDNESTIDDFSNGQLLKDIYQSSMTLHITCNAGVKMIHLHGTLPGYGDVWYHTLTELQIFSL